MVAKFVAQAGCLIWLFWLPFVAFSCFFALIRFTILSMCFLVRVTVCLKSFVEDDVTNLAGLVADKFDAKFITSMVSDFFSVFYDSRGSAMHLSFFADVVEIFLPERFSMWQWQLLWICVRIVMICFVLFSFWLVRRFCAFVWLSFLVVVEYLACAMVLAGPWLLAV